MEAPLSNMEDHLIKLREERVAREKARIQKLRELNLKKYPKTESQPNIAASLPSTTSKPVKAASASQIKGTMTKNVFHAGGNKNVKNNFHVNGTSKRPITAPVPKIPDYSNVKPKVVSKIVVSNHSKTEIDAKTNKLETAENKTIPIPSTSNANYKSGSKIVTAKNGGTDIREKPTTSNIGTSKIDKKEHKVLTEVTRKQIVNPKIFSSNNLKSKKSLPAPINNYRFDNKANLRKPMLPKLVEESKSESVFERLYKPKYIARKSTNDIAKLKTEPSYLKKLIKNSDVILNKRHTMCNTAASIAPRRSISAVHFKRISKNELGNCIHKWASIGDQLNKQDLEIDEDDKIIEDKVVSAIRSERKKVKFMTPVASNFNTPSPEELQARLKTWLQKHGKALNSYHHLQCFGMNHLKSELGTPKCILLEAEDYCTPKSDFDEENKENIALDSDSDDGSYADTMNEPKDTLSSGDKIDIDNWRHASINSESIGFNESTNFNEITITSADTIPNVDELLVGALTDLTALLHEGFDWQQSARWLRSIRERFPFAPRAAAYWECRAALEESRGNVPASIQCWEEAIAKGSEHSVAESNLDQLLTKFMHLKISPQSGAKKNTDPKMLNVKNVFKSTIIRFAVQQAKLRRQSEPASPQVFTVTPVRRSARLSHCRTPLQLCDTVRQAATIAPQNVFLPNENFVLTP